MGYILLQQPRKGGKSTRVCQPQGLTHTALLQIPTLALPCLPFPRVAAAAPESFPSLPLRPGLEPFQLFLGVFYRRILFFHPLFRFFSLSRNARLPISFPWWSPFPCRIGHSTGYKTRLKDRPEILGVARPDLASAMLSSILLFRLLLVPHVL